ncbi:ABC transporter ATP-binding protein [Acidovorax sp.]|uniref:ABC transporter ATP-binding protein n=1 Tax=Acidovorax sp. TaxID=1872122 RepID=UPI001AD49DAF|nr:ABC transporter ATP-binding protein [Acidovorax sp.]MBN9627288.1 ABC transporter ATP-binding protein [Acidovorax sp.]
MSAQSGKLQVLQVDGVSKEYRLYASARDRLKALVTGKPYHRSHWALRDVTFKLGRGECLGVVGNNGAGKSSLLKLLAGTLLPTQGKLERAGRVTAILELGAGFHPDFTGRENLYFAGNIIGIPAPEMRRLEPEIVAFSELGEALERPVKTYSSGMVVRLAFALVTAVQPDLLIIDEALAVGDQHFQKKCVDRIDAFRRNGCTILFCSHSLYHVRQLCDRALWLDGGVVKALGDTESVLAAYEKHVRMQEQTKEAAIVAVASAMASNSVQPDSRSAACIVSVALDGLGLGEPPLLESEDLVVHIEVFSPQGAPPSIGVMLEQAQGVGIDSVATHADGVLPKSLGAGRWRSTLTFSRLPLHTGEYVVSAYLFDGQGLVVFEEWRRYLTFRVMRPSLTPGLVRLEHNWS